jgi:ERCC4-type nuclease
MKAADLLVYVDTREQSPPPFPAGVTTERVTMSEGDYTTRALQGIAAVERKSVCDYASSTTRDRERLEDELRRLREYRWKAIVVEGEIGEVYRVTRAHPNSILGTVASLMARWDCPVLFAGNAAGAGRLIAGCLKRWEHRIGEVRGGHHDL